jgi:hypothetical protein
MFTDLLLQPAATPAMEEPQPEAGVIRLDVGRTAAEGLVRGCIR